METDIESYCKHGDLYWNNCYGSGAKYNKYTVPESVKHPAKMSFELLERIFKHLESMNLLTHDSIVIDFMAGSGRSSTMAALRRYRTISVELEPHFIEMMAGYDCDGKSITDFRIEPCLCKSDVLHKPHKITGGLCEVECSGNPRIVPVCRCGEKRHHTGHHVIGNKELLEQVTGRKVNWQIIQGDARELTRLLHESGLAGVVSPPYAQDQHSRMTEKCAEMFDGRSYKVGKEYSPNPDNIGNLKDIPIAGVISPPYQDTAMPMGCPAHIRKLAREGRWDEAIELEREAEAEQAKKGKKFAVSTDDTIRKKIEMALEREKGNYSEDAGNIGNLKDVPLAGIFSPPYSQAQEGGGIAIQGYRGSHTHEQGKNQPDKVGQRCGYMKEVHGDDPANIGNLPDKPIVGITSPPHADAISGNSGGSSRLYTESESPEGCEKLGTSCQSVREYSGNEDNIGNQQGESYLSAMLKAYQQAFLCGISPLVVVTKNPTRNGKLRRLDLDTIFLLQQSGYEIFDYHRAVLFEEQTQETLDGKTKKTPKGRLSFFKRLSYAKGTEIARWEDAIFARIP